MRTLLILPALLMLLRRLAALSLATGCLFHCRWLPSEANEADAPSRQWENSRQAPTTGRSAAGCERGVAERAGAEAEAELPRLLGWSGATSKGGPAACIGDSEEELAAEGRGFEEQW